MIWLSSAATDADEARRYADAERLSRLHLSAEPYDEGALRSLMRALWRQGRRNAAIDVFRDVSGRIRADLSVSLEYQTEALLREIRSASAVQRSDASKSHGAEADRSPAAITTPEEISQEATLLVMPFEDLTSGATSFLAEGLSEDLIVALSRYSDVSVIAINTAIQLAKGHQPRPDALREVVARYLVSGTLRASGDRLRITVRLSEIATGTALWSETFDRRPGDLFQVQDEIVQAVAGRLPWRVLDSEARRTALSRPVSLTSYQNFIRANWERKRYGDIHREEAEFRALVDADPDFAPARSHLGFLLGYKPLVTGLQTDQEVAESLELARSAVSLAPGNERVLAQSSATFQMAGDYLSAQRHSARAILLNPNSTECTHFRASILAASGDAEAAMVLHRKTAALDPLFPESHYEGMMEANFILRRYADALACFRRWAHPPRHALALAAACHSMLGDKREAEELVAVFTDTAPEGFSNKVYVTAFLRFYAREMDRDQFLRGLQDAGMPGIGDVRLQGDDSA